MRTTLKIIAMGALTVFLMSVILLSEEGPAKPPAGANDSKALESSSASSAEPAAPMPAGSMGAAMPYARGEDIGTPTAELFLGYSYLRAVPQEDEANRLVWLHGGSANIAFNFNRHWGLVADIGGFKDSELKVLGANGIASSVVDSSGSVYTYLIGPRFSFRNHGRVTPFVQALFGAVRASQVGFAGCGPNCFLPAESSFAMTAGGGLDVRVHRHFAIRLIQAEYLMTRFDDLTAGKTAMQNDMRLSSGIVFRFGGNTAPPLPPREPLAYSCSVNPASAFPGDPIAASGTAVNLDPTKTAVYTWSVDGGTVSGVSSTARIETTNLAAGAYTLKGHVSQGDTPGDNADCTAPYAVKAYEPPTVGCSANPATVTSGEPSTITATGVSPQSRPLTYSYSSTTGTVSGTGTTATLSTSGAALGTATVTCNVVDDKGQPASGTTSVTIAPLAVAPKPQTSELCSIQFGRDVRRPARVDNEAKACLDEIALNLQRSSDARIAVVGNASSDEKGGKKMAAERAVNTKAYLVTEKGVDPSRISAYTGSQNGMSVSTTLIPTGAALDTAAIAPVDESAVKPRPAATTPHHTSNPH